MKPPGPFLTHSFLGSLGVSLPTKMAAHSVLPVWAASASPRHLRQVDAAAENQALRMQCDQGAESLCLCRATPFGWGGGGHTSARSREQRSASPLWEHRLARGLGRGALFVTGPCVSTQP